MTVPRGPFSRLAKALAKRLSGERGIFEDATNRKNLLQLVHLRWIAVAGQVATISVAVVVFRVGLPLAPMAMVLAFLVVLNGVSLWWLKRAETVNNSELFLALMLDMTALTAQLYLSGGATNPFISLFLLQITLGAVLLERRSTWVLVGLTAVCFAGLTAFYQPLKLTDPGTGHLFNLHIQGMLACFLLDSTLLVIFVERISRNLRVRDAGLADLRQRAAEEDHIVRMGLLATGAAHELGTPLATLSVILNDWRAMPSLAADAQLVQEIADMEGEVRRCKTILSGILLSAGEARGESPTITSVKDFLDGLIRDWGILHPAVALHYRCAFKGDIRIVSDAALRQVVCNVLDNAFDASPAWVSFTADRVDEMIVITVNDRGAGFTPAVLADLGKPYNSTKGRQGGGLGLFLVTNVVRKLGGSVIARNEPLGGATVTLSLPFGRAQNRKPHRRWIINAYL